MSDSSTTEVEIRPGVWLNAAPALFLAAARTLVVADVHWGYAASQRAAGRLLPDWGDGEIEQRLDTLVMRYQPERLVVLGDVVHARAAAFAAETALARLHQRLPELVLIAGNHDRGWSARTVPSLTLPGYFLHHGDRALTVPAGCIEVIGHHHPAATWSDRAGTRVKLPALVEGPRRIILPAFSPWAGGVSWTEQLQPGERLWLISPRRIFPVAAKALA